MTAPVVLYKDANYASAAGELQYGRYDDIAKLTGFPNNSASSITVAPFTRVTLYARPLFGAPSVVINGPINITDLRKYGDNFNDRAMSAVVEKIAPSADDAMKCCTGATPVGNCAPYIPGSQTCNGIIAGHCSKNLGTAYCQSWCKQHPELCDSMVSLYCSKNVNDPYCSCINSAAKGFSNPKCVDRACINTGYMTQNMLNTACPTQIDCSIRAKLINTGVSLATNIPIEQNCGTTDVVVTNQSAQVTTAGTGNAGGSVSSVNSGTFWFMIMFVFILFIGVIIGAVIYLTEDDTWATPPPSQQ